MARNRYVLARFNKLVARIGQISVEAEDSTTNILALTCFDRRNNDDVMKSAVKKTFWQVPAELCEKYSINSIGSDSLYLEESQLSLV